MSMDETASSEIKFARKLAANDAKERRSAMKGLGAWIDSRTTKKGLIDELELQKVWRGFFFCMWLADKAPVQHELAENIGAMVHVFKTDVAVSKWIEVCDWTMRREWGKLDKYRVDKYYVLLRRCLFEVLMWLEKHKWSKKSCGRIGTQIAHSWMSDSVPIGIAFHFHDIFLEELGKIITEESVPPAASVAALLTPLVENYRASTSTFETRIVKGFIKPLPAFMESNKVDGTDFNKKAFDIAADGRTSQRHRKVLYRLCMNLSKQTGKDVFEEPECEETATEGGEKKRKKAKEVVPKKETKRVKFGASETRTFSSNPERTKKPRKKAKDFF